MSNKGNFQDPVANGVLWKSLDNGNKKKTTFSAKTRRCMT